MLPRSKFSISFSDGAHFSHPCPLRRQRNYRPCGEWFADCLYLRSRKFPFGRLMIPANIAINAITAGLTFLCWELLKDIFFLELDIARTPQLITAMGLLAGIQFLVYSVGGDLSMALPKRAERNAAVWVTWKRDCFSSSMTQIVGAGLAGLVSN